MNILLVTPNYPPEIGGAAHLVSELAASLKAKGHGVTVLTNYPCYNVKVTPPQYRRGLRMTETLNGITIKRIRIPSLPRNSRIARGFEHLFFGLWLSVLTATVPRADVAMAFSPPLAIPWMIGLIGKMRRMPAVVTIQDLFPREAVELGMLTNPLLIRLFEMMERQVYSLAARVTVHSPGNKGHVVQQAGGREHVHVVGNWVDLNRIRPGNNDNGFARKHGLGSHFVVSYAGTMGWAQDMETIIKSAARLREDNRILFLLVGDGVEKQKAQAMARKMGLKNIRWLPIQPWSVYPEILSASDVCLINLHPELRTPVVPSKLLGIMAAARPVIASLPAESDARRIIGDANCGIYVDAGDEEALAEAIRNLASDRRMGNEMGQRGRAYAEKHFSREVCTDK
ncbi:MAG: glycosyltransferase family 4 protein, partial [Candidatus Aminicenantes bacterium]